MVTIRAVVWKKTLTSVLILDAQQRQPREPHTLHDDFHQTASLCVCATHHPSLQKSNSFMNSGTTRVTCLILTSNVGKIPIDCFHSFATLE